MTNQGKQNQTLAIAKPEAFTLIDTVARDTSLSIANAGGMFAEAHAMAVGIKAIREAISDEVMDTLMPLQNTALGFKTDNRAGYQKAIVKDCFIEATLRGVKPVGNEFNIIQERCYITKEGFQGKLMRLQGFTDLKEDYGVPKMKEGGAIVEASATWKMNGVEGAVKAEIPVRVNNGMGADAILGKAQRKFLKRVYERATGKVEPDGDADEVDLSAMKTARATVEQKPTATFQPKEGELV